MQWRAVARKGLVVGESGRLTEMDDAELIQAGLDATAGMASYRDRERATGISASTWRRWVSNRRHRKLNTTNRAKLLDYLQLRPDQGESYRDGVRTAINAAREALDDLERRLTATLPPASGRPEPEMDSIAEAARVIAEENERMSPAPRSPAPEPRAKQPAQPEAQRTRQDG